MFFQANGHERVLAILRKPQAFSESVVIEAASIVAHLSSSCTLPPTCPSLVPVSPSTPAQQHDRSGTPH